MFSKYNGVEELLDLSEKDIRDMGVKISSHRALIMTSITALKAKYNGKYLKNKYCFVIIVWIIFSSQEMFDQTRT